VESYTAYIFKYMAKMRFSGGERRRAVCAEGWEATMSWERSDLERAGECGKKWMRFGKERIESALE